MLNIKQFDGYYYFENPMPCKDIIGCYAIAGKELGKTMRRAMRDKE
jgi:hypothetical protein